MEEGQDSFLDVISNMVGILIILVMIAGVRASYSDPEPGTNEDRPEARVEASTETPGENAPVVSSKADPEMLREIEEQYRQFLDRQAINAGLRSRLNETSALMARIRAKIASQSREGAELLDTIATIKAAMEIHEEELDEAEREMFRLKTQLATVDVKLEAIDRQRQWLDEHRPTATVLENRPTPLGRTVEGKEVHFRLLAGRLSYVPFDSLFEKMKADVGLRKNDFFKQSVSTGTVGPLDGYRLRYRVVSFDVLGPEGTGRRMELDCFELIAVGENPDGSGSRLGETTDEALRENSDLMRRLSRYMQDLYTITVWVYPDSFEDFQRLKHYLYQRGYKVAARPLELGQPISASPNGTKSTAQ